MMADAEEGLNKPYDYPNVREPTGGMQQEDDDGNEEMTHANDKNDASENKDDVSSSGASTTSNKPSVLDEVVVEKQLTDIESIDDMMTSLNDGVHAVGHSGDERTNSKLVEKADEDDSNASDHNDDGFERPTRRKWK